MARKNITEVVCDLNEEVHNTISIANSTEVYDYDLDIALESSRTNDAISSDTMMFSETDLQVGSETCVIEDIDDTEFDTKVIVSETQLYFQDLKQESCKTHLFSDDANEFFRGSNPPILLRILHNPISDTTETARSTLPKNILKIDDTTNCFGVYTLKAVPNDVIFGPYYGLTPLQSTTGCAWKMKGQSLVITEKSNWMQFIKSVESISHQNLMAFQCEGNLYYKCIRKILAGEELFVHYEEDCIKNCVSDKETYYHPIIKEEFGKMEVYACTLCCLGFATNVDLQKHRSHCPNQINPNKSEDVSQCTFCKIYLDQVEYALYHKNNCCARNKSCGSSLVDAPGTNDNPAKGSENILISVDELKKYLEAEISRKSIEDASDTDSDTGTGENLFNKKKRAPDCCLFCNVPVSNFARHMRRTHMREKEVEEIFSLPSGDQKRKRMLAALRKKGNYLNHYHKPARTPRLNNKVSVCPYCMGYYSSKQMWRHKKQCMRENGSKVLLDANAERTVVVKNTRSKNSVLRRDVIPHLQPDKISWEAAQDTLICAFASKCAKIRPKVVSKKMRELAKLLLEMRKIECSIKNLYDALQPKHFHNLIQMLKQISVNPVLTASTIHSLKECCQIAFSKAKYKKDTTAQIKLKCMFDLLQHSPAEICKQTTLSKVTLIALTRAVMILQNYLNLQALEAASKLTANNNDRSAYKILLEATFCKLILLNGLEAGQSQTMLLKNYEQVNPEVFPNKFSLTMIKLLQKFSSITVDNTLILFNIAIREHIDLLIKCRSNLLRKENLYLFADSESDRPISGDNVFKTYVEMSKIENPNAVISQNLREVVARITQLLHMTAVEIEELIVFMGSKIVQRPFESIMSNEFELAKILKLMELMEKGQAQQFRGKSLDKIYLKLDDDISQTNQNFDNYDKYYLTNIDDLQCIEDGNFSIATSNQSVKKIKKIKPISKKKSVGNSKETVRKTTTAARKRILVPWTQEQKKVVLKFFERHIENKKPPRKNECDNVIKLHPVLLCNKNWLKIKVFVQNVYTKRL